MVEAKAKVKVKVKPRYVIKSKGTRAEM
jgi:hypothetical protein